MRRYILILSSCLILPAGRCATEFVYITPDIPAETLTPCPISDRRPETVNDLARLALEHRRSAECANGKVEAIATILAAGPR